MDIGKFNILDFIDLFGQYVIKFIVMRFREQQILLFIPSILKLFKMIILTLFSL